MIGVQIRERLAPKPDALGERARRICLAGKAERQRGVEVKMRVHEGRRHQQPARVDLVRGGAGDTWRDRDDTPARRGDVDAGAAVGQGGVANKKIEHHAGS